MSLQAGYNLVTDRVEDPNEVVGALAFFRRLSADESLPDRISVTGLDNLIYRVDESDVDEVIRELRDVLRNSNSLHGPKAVQFVFDGTLINDDVFSVRIERDGDAVYLPVGDLFVEEPRVIGPNHAVARK